MERDRFTAACCLAAFILYHAPPQKAIKICPFLPSAPEPLTKRWIRTILFSIISEERRPRSMMYTMGMLMCNTVFGAF